MSRATSQKTAASASVPNDLEAFWLPFTANRAFKSRPRLIARAKDMYYYTPEGRRDPRRRRRLVVLQCRAQPRPDRGRDPAPGGRARFRAVISVHPSARL